MKLLKLIAGLVVALVVLVILTLLALPSVLGSDAVKGMLASRVEAQTGRSLTIEGDIDFALWPKIRLRTGAIALGNAEGFGEQPFFSLDELEVAIATWPLVLGDYRMDVLTLHGAELRLAVAADGTTNWQDLAEGDRERDDDDLDDDDDNGDDDDRAEDDSDTPDLGDLPALALGGVDIADGRLYFSDARTGQAITLEGLSVQTGALVLGEPIDLEVKVKGQAAQPSLSGDLALTSAISYDLGAERYQLLPLSVTANLAGPTVPNGAATLRFKSDIDARLGKGEIDLKDIVFEAPGTRLTATLNAIDLKSNAPGGAGTVTLSADDLGALAAMFNLPIARQLVGVTDRSAELALNFDANMRKGEVSVSKLDAQLLGAFIEGKLAGSRVNTETPALSASLSARGPDLPALVALGGTLTANDMLVELGAGLSKEPRRAFDVGLEVDADLKSGRVSARDIRADALNLVLRANLDADNIHKDDAPIAGSLIFEAPKLDQLFKSLGQPLLADVIASLSIEADVAGTSEEVSLAPFSLKAGVGGPLLGTAQEMLELSAARAVGNLDSERVKVEGLSLTGLGLALSGDIEVTDLLETPKASGQISLPAFDLRALTERLKIALPEMADNTTLKKVGLSTRFAATDKSLDLDALTLTLDESSLTGELEVVDFASQDTRFDLALDRIDLDRYMPPAPATGDAQKSAAPATPETAAAAAAELPVEMLRALKVSGDLKAGELKASNISLTNLELALRARDGLIRIDPVSANLYEGRYSGKVTLDATGDVPALAIKSKIGDVQVRPLLSDLANQRMLGGTASVDVDLTAVGAAVPDLEKTLNGTVKMAVTEGTIRGLTAFAKFGQRIGSVTDLVGKDSAQATGEEKKELYFTGLSATAVAKDGVITNDDLTLEAPLLRATGSGTLANLPAKTLDYATEVTVVATLSGEGGTSLSDLTGLPVPVLNQFKGVPIGARVSGSFAKPETDFDLGGLASQLPGGGVRDALLGAEGKVSDLATESVETVRDKLLDKLGVGTPPAAGAAPDAAAGEDTGADGATGGAAAESGAPDPASSEPAPAESSGGTVEEKVEEEAKKLLKGLFN